MKKVIILILVILLAGCGIRKEFEFEGQTMGTTYHIKVVTWKFKNMKDLRAQIDSRLVMINDSMSTYKVDSEINRFNTLRNTRKKFYVSKDFLNVTRIGKQIYYFTGGAWDGTVMPLVKLWGFSGSGSGIREMRSDIPDKALIKKKLSTIGFGKIDISEEGYLQKRDASVSIDFASIAKGYAVDQIAKIIRESGVDDFLVEIGGEVYASGFRRDGKKWRVGVNMPKKGAPHDRVYEVLAITNKALATSGDYRNYFEVNGKYYSHIIDPRTGYPVTNGVVSVSILADTCVLADGLATGILVLGQSEGVKVINQLDNVECLIVVKDKAGGLINYYSKGFTNYQQ